MEDLSWIFCVVSISIEKCPDNHETEKILTERKRGSNITTEAEIRVTKPQVKDC